MIAISNMCLSTVCTTYFTFSLFFPTECAGNFPDSYTWNRKPQSRWKCSQKGWMYHIMTTVPEIRWTNLFCDTKCFSQPLFCNTYLFVPIIPERISVIFADRLESDVPDSDQNWSFLERGIKYYLGTFRSHRTFCFVYFSYSSFNHNYNKILASDWLSPAMILGTFRFEYHYEIEYEYDFSNPVRVL